MPNIVALLLITLFFANVSFAQNIPSGSEPGAQSSRYQKELETEQDVFQKKKIKPPKIEIEKEPVKPKAEEKVSFILKEVKISGSTVFTDQDFIPLYQSYLNKKVTFSDLEDIAEKIRALYRKKEYFTTLVYIPSQEIAQGKIEILVVEGKMGNLKTEGNKWFSSQLLEKYFHSKKNEILDISLLQKDLIRLNKNPDLDVKAIISAGEVEGTSDITLKVADKRTFHGGLNSDNQGTRLTGKTRGSVVLRSSNLTGNMDSMFFNSMFSYLSIGESMNYVLPIDTYGTKFGVDLTWFHMKIGKEFKTSDITGTSEILTPYLMKELYLSSDFEAGVNLGLEIKSIRKKTLGQSTASDQLRLPYFGFDFTRVDPQGGQSVFSPKFVFGTSRFLGASKRNQPSASRDGTGGFFFKYEQTLNHSQRMPFESYLSMRSQFQLASHTLASSEQLQLGGAYSVRGYPEGDYLADAGMCMNFDWSFPMYIIPKDIKLKNSTLPLRYQIEPVLFFDVGGGKIKKVNTGEIKNKFLAGVGAGLRMRVVKSTYLRLDWALAIGEEPVVGSGPSTFYFTFQSDI